MVYILEIENGLKITETIGANTVIRYVTSLGFPFIRSTNELEATYQVVDTVGEIYNLPAVPSDFTLESITGNIYLSATGEELIENSLHLRPFRTENLEDRVISLGTIVTTSSAVTVNLPSSGINSILINGNIRERYIKSQFTFTAVTTGIKVLIIYGLDTSEMLYLSEGTEGVEAVEPSIPTGALFVSRLIVSTTGVIVQDNDTTYKIKSDDTIYPIVLDTNSPTWVFGNTTTYDITATGSVTTPTIAGFKYGAQTEGSWNGKKSVIRNRTGMPLLLKKVAKPVDGNVYFAVKGDFTLADGKDAFVIYDNNNEVAVIEIGGGASYPIVGNDGDLLQKDATLPDGVKWVNGSSLGKNISNTNLVWSADRTQNLNGKTLYFTGSGTSKFKLDYLFLEPQLTPNSIPNKTWSDGYYPQFTDKDGINYRGLISKTVTGTFNPPTLAQLTTLGIKKGEFYKNSSTNQIAFFNGEQLVEWTVTTTVWNTLTTNQKNAVKNIFVSE